MFWETTTLHKRMREMTEDVQQGKTWSAEDSPAWATWPFDQWRDMNAVGMFLREIVPAE